MRFAARVYRQLLRAYPREFRDEYGEEMTALFVSRTAGEGIRPWLQALADALFRAPREHWQILRQDVRYAVRTWYRAPAVPMVATTALMLGMGANIAIFSVAYAVLLRPLPFHDPAGVMVLQELRPGSAPGGASFPNFLSWKERSRTLALAAYSGSSLTWLGSEHPERLEALATTASFLSVIGGSLDRGRWFTADEERPEHPRVTVLSHRLWRTRFGADPDVIGQRLVLNATPHTVVGVASVDLSVPFEPDLWVPQVGDPSPTRRANRYLQVIGRLGPGFSRAQAQDEMSSIARALAAEYPDANRDFGIAVIPLSDTVVPRDVRSAIGVLLAAAALVLVIACANVATVLLSRATSRRREMAVRTALGAGASRLTRQLLTEHGLLSLGGGLAGLLLAVGIVSVGRRALAEVVPRMDDVSLNIPVLAFALGLIVLATVAFGSAPLWQISRARRGHDFFHPTGRDDRAVTANRLRTMLVVTQVCLTTLLLVGAALLMQSLARLQSVPVGIQADSVVTAKLSLSRARLAGGPAIGKFLSSFASDLENTPGIRSAGFSSAIPLSPGAHTMTRAAGDDGPLLTCQWRLVDSGYFRTLRIPLVHGRLFGPEDAGATPRVFVIGQQTARDLYGAANPIGRRLRLDNGVTGEVIGVIADVRLTALDEAPERVVYFPPWQFGFFPQFNVIVQADGSLAATAAAIRERLKQLDPNLAAYEIQPMQHWIDRSAALMRIRTWLIASLGALALLLGVVGIYATTAYLVARRSREFGIRIALGARPGLLPLVVVGQGLRVTLAGIVLGLIGAAVAIERVRDLLFQVDARNPMTFAIVAAIVALVGMAAAYLPARRIAATDPALVLRAE